MQLTDIGQLCASRTLTLTKNNLMHEVKITIGNPQKFSDGNDFYCAFQITGIGDEKVNWSGGIDAVQALLVALEAIGILLTNSEEYKQGKLSWEGSTDGILGFPHHDSSGLLANF